MPRLALSFKSLSQKMLKSIQSTKIVHKNVKLVVTPLPHNCEQLRKDTCYWPRVCGTDWSCVYGGFGLWSY